MSGCGGPQTYLRTSAFIDSRGVVFPKAQLGRRRGQWRRLRGLVRVWPMHVRATVLGDLRCLGRRFDERGELEDGDLQSLGEVVSLVGPGCRDTRFPSIDSRPMNTEMVGQILLRPAGGLAMLGKLGSGAQPGLMSM